MCRWISLLASKPVSLADVVSNPSNSLIHLSKDASYHPGATEKNNHVMNGDGFGVGWFYNAPNDSLDDTRKQDETEADEATEEEGTFVALFKDTRPAWNNLNLKEICRAVKSTCIVAHVRAASPFASVINEQNCHPFKAGRLLFCHNGSITHFNDIRRNLKMLLSNEAYLCVNGTTDSECIFALILTYLSQDDCDGEKVSAVKQTKPFGPKRLTHAVKLALSTIHKILAEAGVDTGYSTLNLCLTDGDTIVVTRYCDKSPQVPPPSLYFAFGEATKFTKELVKEDAVPEKLETFEGEHKEIEDLSETGSISDFGEHHISLHDHESTPGVVFKDIDPTKAIFSVASCPLSRTHSWHPMLENSIMWYTTGSVPEMKVLKIRNLKTTAQAIARLSAAAKH